ncbi:caspase, EACC1-associated type [Streptomyces sp. NPDC054833]
MSSLPDPKLSRAVLIGLSEYDHLPALPAVANNVTALHGFLTSVKGWQLPPQHCVAITEPRTPSDVVDPLRRASAEARDTLLVYYAGHGVLDERLQFYLSLSGSRPDEPWTCVEYDWMRTFLAQSTAHRRVAVLDSCFSGKVHGAMSAATDAVRAQTAARGTVVVTSARDDRVALAPPGETYTAFTGELLAVLHSGIPGGSAEITVDQAYEWVRGELTRKGRPRPDRTGSDTAGAVVLARNHAFDGRGRPSSAPMSTKALLRQLARRLNVSDTPPVAATSPADPLDFGNRYRVAGLLGSGSISSVYLAADQMLARWVAVKFMRPTVADPDFDLAFPQEARTLAALTHHVIATVHDMGSLEGVPYFVMEYVRGADLPQLLDTAGWLGVSESAAVILEVLDALEYAHAQGVIHCDVKPSNIMLTADGKVKVLDFGIAALAADLDSGLHGREGILIGTPTYLAPEAVHGAPPDVQRDLYAVGMTLYELLTGRNPFMKPGMSPLDIVMAQVEKAVPPPSTANPALPPECDRILLKALAKDPDARYRSASELTDAVLSLLRSSRSEN